MRNIRNVFLMVFLINLSSCVLLDPNYYIWKDVNNSRNDLSPWSGVQKQPKDQYRKYFIGYPMSTKDYRTEGRWRISVFDKRYDDEFVDEMGKYLAKNNILQRFGYHLSRRGYVYGGKLPYELTYVSIKPTIVLMRPYIDSDFKKHNAELEYPKGTGFSMSKYFVYSVRYGTKFKYQSDLLFFSPDLDILPQPLNLKEGKKQTIYWNKLFNKGAIEFVEDNGVVYTKRLANKSGKDSSNTYQKDYHLTLINWEKEAQIRWKQYQKERRRAIEKRNNLK